MLIEGVDKENRTIQIIESGFGLGGGRYAYEEHYDKFDIGGSIQIADLENRFKDYYNKLIKGKPLEEMCLIRIVNDGESYLNISGESVMYDGITEASKSRLNMPSIDIEKTLEISDGVTTEEQYILADLGDIITYTLTISNNSNGNYNKFNVIENIDTRLTVLDNGNGTLKDNKLNWSISSLNAGETRTIIYKVKVPNDKSLLGNIIVSEGKVDNIATSKIETLIGNKLEIEEKVRLLSSYNKLKTSSDTERDFINNIYKDAFNVNLELSNSLTNFDIMSFDYTEKNNNEEELVVNYAKLKEIPIKKYVYQNFYGLRIADAHNKSNGLVRASLQWKDYRECEFTDRARTLTSNMLDDGDIILVYVGETKTTDENLVNKSYIFLDNKLVRKTDGGIEELSGENLTKFLRDILCDNFIVLRPVLFYGAFNYDVDGIYYETLEEAYESISGEKGIIKANIDNIIDDSKLGIEEGKEIILDLNGKIINKTTFGIVNNGTLTITDFTNLSDGELRTVPTEEQSLQFLISNNGTLNINGGRIYNSGITDSNWYTIICNDSTQKPIINVNGGIVEVGLSTAISPASGKDGRAIYVRTGALNITNGTVKNTCVDGGYAISSYISYNGAGSIKISGGYISNVGGPGINIASSNNMYINGTTVEMAGGTVIGSTYGIYCREETSGDIILYNGIIEGDINGIINLGTGTIRLGRKKVELIGLPYIAGGKIGIISNSEFEFYDGIIKGVNEAYQGIAKIVENYEIVSSTENIEGVEYKVAYLRYNSKGDVNLDGKVNSTDLQRLYSHLNGSNIIKYERYLTLADVNNDGNVNSTDLQRLYSHLNGSNLLNK